MSYSLVLGLIGQLRGLFGYLRSVIDVQEIAFGLISSLPGLSFLELRFFFQVLNFERDY